MSRIAFGLVGIVTVAAVGTVAIAAQDKYALEVPGGLALSECRGFEDWAAVAVSRPEDPEKLNLIVANPEMIAAYLVGFPGNGQPFPDGSKIMKMLWLPRTNEVAPFAVQEPGTLTGIGCMVKDSKRFADTGGWGYMQFDYDPASDTFKPNTALQGNDAKCGAVCHQAAEATDFVFTSYAKR